EPFAPLDPSAWMMPLTVSEVPAEICSAPPPAPRAELERPPLPPPQPPVSGTSVAGFERAAPPTAPFAILASPPFPPAVPKPPPPPPLPLRRPTLLPVAPVLVGLEQATLPPGPAVALLALRLMVPAIDAVPLTTNATARVPLRFSVVLEESVNESTGRTI